VRAALLALTLTLAAAPPIAAQVRPRPTRADSLRADSARREAARRPATDTLRRRAASAADTSAADSVLVEWAPTDSVMDALMRREGYGVVRYQADGVRFDAATRVLTLTGDPAAIERDQSVLVSDTVVYVDSTQRLLARGDTIILRDPTQGSDVVSRGSLTYDIAQRAGTITDFRTSVNQGEEWIIGGEKTAALLADSARGRETTFYVHDGRITSCDLLVPHYHFKAREIKVVAKNIMVARPAVLYIADVPVMWLPFVFQDLRSGRRSGLIPPSIGVSDIVRNSPSYRRQVENLGWYWAFNDYTDLKLWLDWRSGARPRDGDPGWTQYNGEFSYAWLNRFLSGQFAAARRSFRDGTGYTNLGWTHSQNFNEQRRLSANLRWAENTVLQQLTETNPVLTSSNIVSSLNYSDKIGPFSLSAGGDRTQYSGRPFVSQSFPRLNLATQPIEVARWLTWTPKFSFNRSERLNDDRTSGSVLYRYVERPGGGLDSVRILPDSRTMSTSFDTPITIFGFNWQNSIRIEDQVDEAPRLIQLVGDDPSAPRTPFLFRDWYSTDIDWQTSFSLPNFLPGRWNVTPSVSLANVAGGPFAIRNRLSGGEWVYQTKRPSFSLNVGPTVYGLFPGFGGFARIRHAIQPSLTYSYAPSAEVSDEYLAARNLTREGSNIGLAQNQLGLSINQTFEAKRRSTDPNDPDGGEKLKLLSLTFSALNYDFELARKTGRSGLTTNAFSYSARSDLLPGLNVRVRYDLFEGVPGSDTARFSPFLSSIEADVQINRRSNPWVMLQQIFGLAAPVTEPVAEPREDPERTAEEEALSQMPVAGARRGRFERGIDTPQEWQASLQFSSSTQRPIRGALPALDPAQVCEVFRDVNPFQYQQCRLQFVDSDDDPDDDDYISGQVIRASTPSRNLSWNMSAPLTPKWAVQWSSNYDFVRKDFAQQIMTLQRDLHDWRAIFNFSRATNGAFAFSFFISLKAQPELKFDYHETTTPSRRTTQ
jgi:hypothetical protein